MAFKNVHEEMTIVRMDKDQQNGVLRRGQFTSKREGELICMKNTATFLCGVTTMANGSGRASKSFALTRQLIGLLS